MAKQMYQRVNNYLGGPTAMEQPSGPNNFIYKNDNNIDLSDFKYFQY